MITLERLWGGVCLVHFKRHKDTRGFFSETFKISDFSQAGLPHHFAQDNHSFSETGVVRGMHYQLPPQAQGKLVWVIRGRIYDVALDLRKQSPTLGQTVGVTLTSSIPSALWIPEGFAHGFCALEPSDVIYKVTRPYAAGQERGIAWNDPDLGIQWPNPGVAYALSAKDQAYPAFSQARDNGDLL